MSTKGSTHKFNFQHVEIYKGDENSLGIGSYGAVYKAKCDELPCAAKILHPVLFQSNDPGACKILQRFEQECSFMNDIRHPNIVLYLGVCRDRDSNLPVLLMELLDESLTKFLEHSRSPLSFHIQLDVCYDVAVALSYLHTNGIIHRDLSSNNVLLVAGSRAKVTDFGMSKLMSGTNLAIQSAATFCPGTEAYMSPEAMKQPPVCTEKLDCFSFGVLVIQVLTCLFPKPGPRTREVSYPGSPTGTIEMPVLETERRSEHIQLVDQANPLLSIAISCLNYNPNERPASIELCKCLAAIQITPKYTDSKHDMLMMRDNSAAIQELQQENSTLKGDLSTAREQLMIKEKLLAEKEHGLKEKNSELQTLQEQYHIQLEDMNVLLKKKDQDISPKEVKLVELHNQIDQGCQVDKDDKQLLESGQHLKDQLKEANQFLSEKELIIIQQKADLNELQQRLDETERELHHVQQMLLKRETEIIDQRQRNSQGSPQIPRHIQQKISQAEATGSGDSFEKCTRIQVTSKGDGKAICKMARGSTAVSGTTIYLRPVGSGDVYAYDSEHKHWSELPHCPLSGIALVMVGRTLTAIGVSESDSRETNILLSCLSTDGTSKDSEHQKWCEQFPAMHTKRYNPAAVCTEQILVVAGGNMESGEKMNVVEVMNLESRKWFVTSELPIPVSQSSAVVYKDSLYLIGGVDKNRKWINSVLTCTIDNLHKCSSEKQTPHKSKGKLQFSRSRSKPKGMTSEWHFIANLPVGRASCVCVGNMLLAVGGVSLGNAQTTSRIHMYNTDGDFWEVVGHMTAARSQCLIASQEDRAVVVGGWLDSTIMTEDIELLECSYRM